LITGESSLYFSNLQIQPGIRFAHKERIELFAGLTRVQDTGADEARRLDRDSVPRGRSSSGSTFH
jgi:hypothetical protein